MQEVVCLPKLKEGYVQLGAAVPAALRRRVVRYQHRRELPSVQDAVVELLQDALDARGITDPEEDKAPESK